MAFVRNVAILLTIAAVAICFNDLGMDCQKISQGTSICTDKPTDYEIHEPKMRDIIKQSENWIGCQNGENEDYDDDDDEKLIFDARNCDSLVKVKKPFVIMQNKTKNYVVQIMGFEQRKITECYNPDATCFDGIVNNERISTACRPKEATISLYVYDKEKNETVYQPFSLPVACTCMMASKDEMNEMK